MVNRVSVWGDENILETVMIGDNIVTVLRANTLCTEKHGTFYIYTSP